MELLKIKDLSFSYADETDKVLSNINIEVNSGDFVIICGESGSGKSTLLKMIKRELQPKGHMTGKILLSGKSQESLSDKESFTKAGFVFQNPDNQIVTDKVWHEMTFGLENMELTQNEMQRRMAEMSVFMGIEPWLEKRTDELSGGEKQKLNIASVVAMRPELLLLDEPVSQLDPIAAEEIIQIIKKINQEFGITIIIAEHNLDDMLECADKVGILNNGSMVMWGSTDEVISKMKCDDGILSEMPAEVRIFKGLKAEGKCPLSIKGAKEYLVDNYKANAIAVEKNNADNDYESVFRIKNISFRYKRNGKNILDDISLNLNKGEIYSILGNNGSGKTTLLKVMAGIYKPYTGRVIDSKIRKAYLPQNPQMLFVKNSLYEDYSEITDNNEEIHNVLNIVGLSMYAERHPYDLSGGQQQAAAIGKLLLTKPDIMFLDEPAKGMDAGGKRVIGKILNELKQSGTTIVIVTHEIEFAAEYSDRCGLFFNHRIIAQDDVRSFFSKSDFYTTRAHKIGKQQFGDVISCKEIINLCKE